MDGLEPCSGAQGPEGRPFCGPQSQEGEGRSGLLAGQVCGLVAAGWSAVLAGQLVGQLALVGQLCLVVSPGRPVDWLQARGSQLSWRMLRETLRDIQSAHSTRAPKLVEARAQANPKTLQQTDPAPIKICAWQACTGTMLIFSVSFQF